MNSAKYRQVVTFQAPITTRVDGISDQSWVTATASGGAPLVDVRAEVLTGPGKQLIAAGMTHNEVAARINVRWFPELKPSWRILHDGDVYDITALSKDSTGRREWRLLCKTGVSSG